LLQSLYGLRELEELSLADDHLGDRFVQSLSLALFSYTLRKLDLCKNQFFDIALLASKLGGGHRNLTVVNLSEALPRSGYQELLGVPSHIRIVGSEGLLLRNH